MDAAGKDVVKAKRARNTVRALIAGMGQFLTTKALEEKMAEWV